MPTTFVTREALAALAKLSGYEVVQVKPTGYSPFRLLGVGDLINWAMPMVPLMRWLGCAAIVILRPVAATVPPSLSIVIPCRNEKGNIEAALQRLPAFPAPVEVIFIEGPFVGWDLAGSSARHRRIWRTHGGVELPADWQGKIGRGTARVFKSEA